MFNQFHSRALTVVKCVNVYFCQNNFCVYYALLKHSTLPHQAAWNVSLPDISSTTAPTKSTAIIPAELQTHGACQGLKGPAHHVSQFHFYKATLSHIFIKKYSQSQRNIKAALSDFWTHLIECWRRTMCIMDFLMFSVQYALCFAFDKWGPNGF